MKIKDKITSWLTGQVFPFTKENKNAKYTILTFEQKTNVLMKFGFFALDIKGEIKKMIKYKVWFAIYNNIHLN